MRVEVFLRGISFWNKKYYYYIIMKYLLYKIVLALLITSCSVYKKYDLGKMSESDREEYLISVGKEVTKAFGPNYYREFEQPIISKEEIFENNDTRLKIQKNLGRKYYSVTFLYDPTKERLIWEHASKVFIWKDSGKPMGVVFGNGHGVHFLLESYKKRLRSKNRIKILYWQPFPMDEIKEANDEVDQKSFYSAKLDNTE